MINEEEKKAIEKALWHFQEVLIRKDDIDQWEVIVNFIEKQQKEIEELIAKNEMKKVLLVRKDHITQELKDELYIRKDTLNIDYIRKDTIKNFIRDELPDDEIMKCCDICDVNGIDIRKKLENLLEEN